MQLLVLADEKAHFLEQLARNKLNTLGGTHTPFLIPKGTTRTPFTFVWDPPFPRDQTMPIAFHRNVTNFSTPTKARLSASFILLKFRFLEPPRKTKLVREIAEVLFYQGNYAKTQLVGLEVSICFKVRME